MTDVALKNAVARAAEIERFIASRQEQIDQLTRAIEMAQHDLEKTVYFIRTWYEMAGIQPPPDVEQVESKAPPPAPRRPKNPDREFVVDKSLQIIRQVGLPMPRKLLFDALAAEGVEIRGKDPEMVLSTMLWRSQDRVVRLRNLGYWPKEETFPDGNYYPALDDVLGAADEGPEDGIIEEGDSDLDELPLG